MGVVLGSHAVAEPMSSSGWSLAAKNAPPHDAALTYQVVAQESQNHKNLHGQEGGGGGSGRNPNRAS